MKFDGSLLSDYPGEDQIVIHYLVHSCVALRFRDRLLLFDYASSLFHRGENETASEGQTGKEDFLGLCSMDDIAGLEVYIFSSHRHGDHYSPELFSLEPSSHIHYFSSFDIPLPRTDHEIHICTPEGWVSGGGIRVFSGPSSDEGVAFWVEVDDKVIYYSGDNAFWDWNKCRVAEGYFKEYLQPFIDLNKHVDVAFSVADPRCYETHYGGISDISTFLDIGLLVPIHNFGDFSHHEKMRVLVQKKHPDQQYFAITGPGQVYTVS